MLTVAALATAGGSVTASTQAVRPDVVVTASEFEVASVRPMLTDNSRRGLIDDFVDAEMPRMVLAAARKGRFRAPKISVHALIQMAYNVKRFQIVGAPSWAGSERFEIEARAAGNPTVDEVRGMFRSLLADRFRLMVHHELRTMPVYELVPGRRGLKIPHLKEGDCITLNEKTPPIPMDLAKPTYICGGIRRKVVTLPPGRSDRIEVGGIAMSQLVDILSDELDRTVVDRTGFTEKFNLLLDFAPPRDFAVDSAASSAPTIFTALEEQLGLRLRATSGSVDVLVVDGVGRPSEN